MTITGKLMLSTAVGALGGLLFGFDTVVISGTIDQLANVFHLSPAAQGNTVAVALWGTVLGSLVSGWLGTKLGGRNALRIMALLYVVSAIGCAAAPSWISLMVLRFIGGIGIGGSSVLGPVYIAELAPAAWRGRLVGTFQVMVVVGILLAYVSNWFLARPAMHLGAAQWRWQLGVAGIPAALFLVLLYTIPQSSRFLISQNSLDDALTVLREMGAIDPKGELEDIRRSIHMESGEKDEPLFQRSLRLPIFLAVTIGMFNQLSGINAILYYLNDIFRFAGADKMSGNLQAIAVGGTNLVATLLAMSIIDKFGRKKLLLTGTVGLIASLSGITYIFYTHHHLQLLVWLLMLFMASFAFSHGAVVWVYISEVLMPNIPKKRQ